MSNQSFSWSEIDLPITEVIPKLLSSVEKNPKTILQAPPGAGKSTLLPLALLSLAKSWGKKIVMLEPRRLAAKSIATRMADLLGEKVGQTVGYRIRFETRVSEQTRIEVITEGILTRMLLSDNAIEDVGMILFDEFHERSIHADLALALSIQSQQVLRPDLKILIMSATLNAEKLAKKLDAPVISSDGKIFPVTTTQLEDADASMLSEQCARVVKKVYKETSGDILVFLPGQREISDVQNELNKDKSIRTYPLYGALPFSKQWRAVQPDPEHRRRIVLATSIAETSLTIEGITTVVDSGFGRSMKYDPGNGLSRLYTYRISQDEAKQRAGRAGRLQAGKCFRMWTAATHHRMDEHRTPEILNQDLTPLVLSLYSWGIHDPTELLWLDPLPNGTFYQSVELLEQLGAIEDNKITALGQKMADLPCHPRMAHMMLEAQQLGDLSLACDLAALVEERDPLRDEISTDISLRVDWLRRKRSDRSTDRSFKRINDIADSYANMLDGELSSDSYDPFECGLLLSHAYPERIAGSQGNRSGRFQLANSHVIKLNREDDLYASSWIVIANMNARDNVGKVFLAAEINPTDLASQVKEKIVIKWDHLTETLITEKQMRVGGLVLSSQPLSDPSPEEVHQVLIGAIKKSKGQLLNFDQAVEQLLFRISLASIHFPTAGFMKTSKDQLVKSCEEWLTPYLLDIDNGKELKKLDLQEIITSTLLTYEQQQLLTKAVPTKLEVPSGSKVQLQYQNEGPPVLAVRIQEIFGLEHSPMICDGKQPLLLHLLSPGFKPVQVTSDLNSFWANTYFEVRKELRRRYPKHVWPDDPTKEPPTNRAKRRT